jgi:hypothetical protein
VPFKEACRVGAGRDRAALWQQRDARWWRTDLHGSSRRLALATRERSVGEGDGGRKPKRPPGSWAIIMGSDLFWRKITGQLFRASVSSHQGKGRCVMRAMRPRWEDTGSG